MSVTEEYLNLTRSEIVRRLAEHNPNPPFYIEERHPEDRRTAEEINRIAQQYWHADRMYTALQRYYMNPATHTPVEPPKPVEDPFLNHYL